MKPMLECLENRCVPSTVPVLVPIVIVAPVQQQILVSYIGPQAEDSTGTPSSSPMVQPPVVLPAPPVNPPLSGGPQAEFPASPGYVIPVNPAPNPDVFVPDIHIEMQLIPKDPTTLKMPTEILPTDHSLEMCGPSLYVPFVSPITPLPPSSVDCPKAP